MERRFRQKEELAEYANMDSFTAQALKMILSPNVKEAFDLSKEPDKVKDRYGRHGFGLSVLLARRLVESGCRFVTASGYKFSQWDAHDNNDKKHREELVPKLDQALSALLEDLDQRGLLESTVVHRHGRVRAHPAHQPGERPRPLATLLVDGRGRRRHPRRPGDRRQ